MRPDYCGTKYYGKYNINDLSPYETKINDIISQSPEINEILELYNIDKILRSEMAECKNEDSYEVFDRLHKRCARQIGIFMRTINDDNFSEIEKNVCTEYYDDFWDVFSQYKTYKYISNNKFKNFLLDDGAVLSYLLTNKDLVEHFKDEFRETLLSSHQSMRIISNNYLERSNKKYHLPSTLTSQDIKLIIEKYVNSENPNPNTLQLIIDAPNNGNCPISARLRITARKKFNDFFKNNNDKLSTYKYGIGVTFKKQDRIKVITTQGNDRIFSIDIDWLSSHLDYPTILNNFIFIFGFFDWKCRSNFPSNKRNISSLEGVFQVKGIKFYQEGQVFNYFQTLYFIYMDHYRKFLMDHDIDIEQIVKWFFETYLPEELHVDGFMYNKSSEKTSYLEKCKNLCSEIESVLAQFQLYVNENEIDRELLEISTEGTDYSKISSLINIKYVYEKSDRVKKGMSLLFSDQSPLAYICEEHFDQPSFYYLLSKKRLSLKSLGDLQKKHLHELLDIDLIRVIKNDTIVLTKTAPILYDLFIKEVICYQYLDEEQKAIVDKMISDNDLYSETTLFSIPEQQYLSYMLNDKLFSNGPEIRNKYAHGNYPSDENKHHENYIFLLNIMIMTIVKINEEILWREEINNKQS